MLDYKNILNQIKKSADGKIDEPLGDDKPLPISDEGKDKLQQQEFKNKPKIINKHPVIQLNSIKEMQIAMANFGKTLSLSIEDPFSIFLKSQINDNTISNVKSIGGISKFQTDGAWGPVTNNHLKEIYEIAKVISSTSNLAMTFGLKIQFTQQDAEIINHNIREEENLSKNKSEDLQNKAKIITPIINKLSEYCKILDQDISHNIEHQKRLLGDTALFTIDHKNDDNTSTAPVTTGDLTGQQVKIVINNKSGIPVNLTNFNIINLQDLNSFKMFLKVLGYSTSDMENKNIQLEVLKQVKEQLYKSRNITKPIPHFARAIR